MSKIELEIPIPQVPGAYVEYEADGDQVKFTLFFAGIQLASDTFKATAANAEGFSYAKHEKTFDAGIKVNLTFEVWIRWNDKKIVLVILYKSPLGKGKKEVWGDF